jgi:hypothetical protein
VKRLLLLLVVVFAGIYGWRHYARLRARGTNEVLAVNHTGAVLERLRIAVAGRTLRLDSLRVGAGRELPLYSDEDGIFDVTWHVRGTEGERHWSGGHFDRGPLLMRHRLEFVPGDGVVWMGDRLAPPSTRKR